jgi:hypothetical protein
MSAEKETQEFTVRLEGLTLDDRDLNRINNVVQKAILSEFAQGESRQVVDFVPPHLTKRLLPAVPSACHLPLAADRSDALTRG